MCKMLVWLVLIKLFVFLSASANPFEAADRKEQAEKRLLEQKMKQETLRHATGGQLPGQQQPGQTAPQGYLCVTAYMYS